VTDSQTIDTGIDLGTTNSVLAVLRDGRPEVLRNNEQQELTPSAVMIDRQGAITVGQRAYQRAEFRPEAVAREFKRAMGSEQTFVLSDHPMSPEELSAEVLKALRADAQARTGNDVTAAVITIPAMFAQAACHATQRAARLAGIDQAPLLQEPIAAGLAYGVRDDAASGYWAVYDLGGGTLDVSIMCLREGRLSVLDHAGDEFLGGKVFDLAVLDHVVAELRDRHPLPATMRRGDRRYPRLKQACEEARIRLSRDQSVVIDVSGIADDAGREIDTYVELARGAYERLIEPDVRRTVVILRDLLGRNHLEAAAVERVIAVGGPTLTPFIRALIESETGIALETRIDPMTVVAQGAAIFAGTVFRESPGRPVVVPGSLDVELQYPPVSEEPETVIGGRIPMLAGSAGATVEVVRGDGSWTSGRIPLRDGKFVVTVPLEPRQANQFGVRAFLSEGSTVRVAPDGFTVRQGIAVEAPPLSKTLSVAVEGAGEHPLAQRVIPRGARLPATHGLTLRTTRALNPGRAEDVINLFVVEGEAERADRNDHVGHLRIDGTAVARALPVGSEVELRLHVTASRQLEITAFVPLLDERFDLTIPDVNRPVPDATVLRAQVQSEQARIKELEDLVPVEKARELGPRVERAVEEALAGDEEAARHAQSLLHEQQTMLDAASDRARMPALESEWRRRLPEASELISEYGTEADRDQLHAIEADGRLALDDRDPAGLDRSLRRLQDLYQRTLMSQPGFWVGFFQEMVEHQAEMSDPATARVLVQQGRAALDRQDLDALRQAAIGLWELLPAARQARVRSPLNPGVRV
jgi:molecular chaperone DnaK